MWELLLVRMRSLNFGWVLITFCDANVMVCNSTFLVDITWLKCFLIQPWRRTPPCFLCYLKNHSGFLMIWYPLWNYSGVSSLKSPVSIYDSNAVPRIFLTKNLVRVWLFLWRVRRWSVDLIQMYQSALYLPMYTASPIGLISLPGGGSRGNPALNSDKSL